MNIKIAVDFDGTLVKHRYPEIGEPLWEGIEFIKSLQKIGVKVFLDTMRSGKELEEAVNFCKDKCGLVFDSIGPHPSQKRWTTSSKVHADYSFDDRNCGSPLLVDEEGKPYVNWEKMKKLFYDRLSLEYNN